MFLVRLLGGLFLIFFCLGTTVKTLLSNEFVVVDLKMRMLDDQDCDLLFEHDVMVAFNLVYFNFYFLTLILVRRSYFKQTHSNTRRFLGCR
jgi:hypothetical protein